MRNWAAAALKQMRETGVGELVVGDLRGPLYVGTLVIKSGDRLRLTPSDGDDQIGEILLIVDEGRARLAQAWGRKGNVHTVSVRRKVRGINSTKVLARVAKI